MKKSGIPSWHLTCNVKFTLIYIKFIFRDQVENFNHWLISHEILIIIANLYMHTIFNDPVHPMLPV